MKVAFANDHAAVEMRQIILEELGRLGVDVIDCGTATTDSVDYPDYAQKACTLVAQGQAERAVLICGSGIGISIAANKVSGIRCALCLDEYSAEMSRLHNNANAIALRGREFDPERNKRILDIWLKTDFSGGERHQKRIDKIHALETAQA